MNGQGATHFHQSSGFYPKFHLFIQVSSLINSAIYLLLLYISLLIFCQIINMNAGKMLCYCRLVYMPMSYLYGKKFVGPITGLIRSLRKELYNEPYDLVNWNKARNTVAKVHAIFLKLFSKLEIMFQHNICL